MLDYKEAMFLKHLPVNGADALSIGSNG